MSSYMVPSGSREGRGKQEMKWMGWGGWGGGGRGGALGCRGGGGGGGGQGAGPVKTDTFRFHIAIHHLHNLNVNYSVKISVVEFA